MWVSVHYILSIPVTSYFCVLYHFRTSFLGDAAAQKTSQLQCRMFVSYFTTLVHFLEIIFVHAQLNYLKAKAKQG
jgi:hypothetical protein